MGAAACPACFIIQQLQTVFSAAASAQSQAASHLQSSGVPSVPLLSRLSHFHGGARSSELVSKPGFQRVVELLEKQTEYLSDKVCQACATQNRQDKNLHLFQPAWLMRGLVNHLDQSPPTFSHQLVKFEPLA